MITDVALDPASCTESKPGWEDARSAEPYTDGPTKLVKVFDGSKTAVALLLSHELAQWMLTCVELQRDTGEIKCDAEDEMALLDQEKETLCARVYATVATENAEATDSDQQAPPSLPQATESSAMRLAKDKMRLLQIELRKDVLKKRITHSEEKWTSYMRNISVTHDEVFIRAGILEDYVDDETKTSTADRGQLSVTHHAQSLGDLQSDWEERQKSDEAAVVDATDSPPLEPDGKALSPLGPSDTGSAATYKAASDHPVQDVDEREVILADVEAKRSARDHAQKAHDDHRGQYRRVFERFASQHEEQPRRELETAFAPHYVRRGQTVTANLIAAEAALEEVEQHARKKGITTTPPELVDFSTDPYLDVNELAAMCAGKNDAQILEWRDAAGPMSPPVCESIASSDEEYSSSEDVEMQDTSDTLTATATTYEQGLAIKAIIFGQGQPFAFCYPPRKIKRTRQKRTMKPRLAISPENQHDKNRTSGERHTQNAEEIEPWEDSPSNWSGSMSGDSDSPEPQYGRARNFEDVVQVYESQSISAKNQKRRMIDEWAQKSRNGQL